MNVFNRMFTILIALAWSVALGASLLLVWDSERFLNIDTEAIQFNFSLALTRAEQVLATVAVVGLILPAMALILFEMASATGRHGVRGEPRMRREEMERYGGIEARLNRVESMVSTQPAAADVYKPVAADTTYVAPAAYVDPTVDRPHRRRWFGKDRTTMSPS